MWLLSTQPRYLFVHIPKTGGTSIVTALRPVSELVPFKNSREGIHLTASMIRFRADVDGAYSFAFVRNPWDRALSLFFHMFPHRYGTDVRGFKGFWECPPVDPQWIARPQVDFIEGLTFVGRFERLQQDFASVCNAIGVSVPLGHMNVADHPPYREFYDADAKRLIEERYAADISAFGYEF